MNLSQHYKSKIILLFYSLLFSCSLQSQDEKHRGFCWEGTNTIIDSDEFINPLKHYNVNWISKTPFIWQPNYNRPEMSVTLGVDQVMWGESEKGIVETTRFAKKAGIKVILKPHIWLRRSVDKWRSEIAMDSEHEWDLWFKNYEKKILLFAKIAEENKIDAFCIGTELRKTIQHEAKWRHIISKIRKIYSGKLTYAANWYAEFEEVKFWDALDFIGVQAYFPLSDKENPSLDDLVSGWQPHLKKLESVATQFSKKIVFTELGYKNTFNTTKEPWLWPSNGKRVKFADGYEYHTPNDTIKFISDPSRKYYRMRLERAQKRHPDQSIETQALAFEAFFKAVWHKKWFNGVHIWKWHPEKSLELIDQPRIRFSPQNSKTMDVIEKWFGT